MHVCCYHLMVNKDVCIYIYIYIAHCRLDLTMGNTTEYIYETEDIIHEYSSCSEANEVSGD